MSPLQDFDRRLFLFDGPTANLANRVWGDAINAAARERKLTIMLTGQMGNVTLSYAGLQLLPELLRSGRLFALWRTAAALVANGNMNWRGALCRPLGRSCRSGFGDVFPRPEHDDVLHLSAIRPERLAELDLRRWRARADTT